MEPARVTGKSDRMKFEQGIRTLLLTGAALLLLAGCSSHGELGGTMSSWQGSHVDDVKLAWGQPTACETYDGRRICSWHDQSRRLSSSLTESCERSLEIDADGYVIGWRWRGDYCYATADQVMAQAQYQRPDALAAEMSTGENACVAAAAASDVNAADPE